MRTFRRPCNNACFACMFVSNSYLSKTELLEKLRAFAKKTGVVSPEIETSLFRQALKSEKHSVKRNVSNMHLAQTSMLSQGTATCTWSQPAEARIAWRLAAEGLSQIQEKHVSDRSSHMACTNRGFCQESLRLRPPRNSLRIRIA